MSKEKGKKKPSGVDQENNHDQMPRGDKVGVEGEVSLTSRVVEDQELPKFNYYNACPFLQYELV